ncbi:MAG: imidazole glycerol phosphate synthase subunit HisF [Anaerolineales bacterium]|nr:imidazole glycerol phosphate synthase subunit HisF [Anaerolineales bacterium]
MLLTRVMPCLLLKDGGLVKTVKFKNPGYIGDPINAIRIYNEKEVDELIFLDISATLENRKPLFKVLTEIASECFMPVTYGGGIRDLEVIREILNLGIEKVAINSYAFENPQFVKAAAERFGSSTIVVSIDARRNIFGKYIVYVNGGRKSTGLDPVDFACHMEEMGVGEILLTSIDRDGTQEGYDVELVKRVTSEVGVPVVACGGAGKPEDFQTVVREGGASACAAGSMVVYFGRNRAVLINFPSRKELDVIFSSK